MCARNMPEDPVVVNMRRRYMVRTAVNAPTPNPPECTRPPGTPRTLDPHTKTRLQVRHRWKQTRDRTSARCTSIPHVNSVGTNKACTISAETYEDIRHDHPECATLPHLKRVDPLDQPQVELRVPFSNAPARPRRRHGCQQQVH